MRVDLTQGTSTLTQCIHTSVCFHALSERIRSERRSMCSYYATFILNLPGRPQRWAGAPKHGVRRSSRIGGQRPFYRAPLRLAGVVLLQQSPVNPKP